ncbi:alpha/beta hydrolase [Glaciibacter flavus]|uniref:Alpha/beta hydrolase n=1 Tax=Orlajensenia flava TaxID=2565934 RepID=A0A4S4FUM4_9MICO|nr:alpha/beta fold hydrolase [Glaciibacter flavus]THG33988.1 alpha/beta hydrolase [Glaciibacter flavus]
MATWVLIHGTPLTPAVWQPVAALLDGPKVMPDCTRVPGRTDAQNAIARTIAPTLPAGRWDVVGHSFGGQIAIELALANAERVKSLTVLCSRDTPFSPFAEVAEAVRQGTGPTVAAGLARWFTAGEIDADAEAVRQARADLAAATASPEDWANALSAIATYDRSADVGRLEMPTYLVAAGRDSVSTPAVMTDLSARLPRATLRVHEDWAHMSAFTDPPALAKMLTTSRSA